MTQELKRLTLVITPEMELLMDRAKQMFYNSNRSEMVRTLISAGLDAADNRESTKKPAVDDASFAQKSACSESSNDSS